MADGQDRRLIGQLSGGAGGGNRGWAMGIAGSGKLFIGVSTDGFELNWRDTGSATVSFADGSAGWVRATVLENNGLGQSVTKFYTSTDGSSWTQLGSDETDSTTSIFDSAAPIEVGSSELGTYGYDDQDIYYAEARNGINGSVVVKFDPMEASPAEAAAGSWTSSVGNAWTINRSGTDQAADIATDLNVGPVTGVPSGGTSDYRFIDGTASYYFPVATSIPAFTPCTIDLGGFTNTSAAGSYSSTIRTWDNSATPALVDSATTATLAFMDYSSSQNVSATVDPSFSFTVANQSSTCNGESNFVSGAGAPTAIALGHLAVSSNVSGGQALSVASNAGNGFVVYIRGTQSTQNLRSAGYNWTDVTGTYASPTALGSGEKFGYTYHDSTMSTSVTNPTAANFAKLDNATTNEVMGSTTSMTGSGCVSFDAQTSSATPAGSYTATVVYTAIPAF